MKGVTKYMAKDRDLSKDYAEILPLSNELKRKYRELNYDTCLHIVLYGTPFSDSRPKPNMRTGGIALKNQEKMKKVFKVLYDRSELLQNLTILSPYHMDASFYLKPTKDDVRYIKKANSKTRKLFAAERLHFMGIKDVDNMLKIHNDILLFDEFRIIIDDAGNVGFGRAEKFLSDTERAEIWIYYSSNPLMYYYNKIINNKRYFRWLMSEKHMKMHHRTSEQQFKHLRKTMMSYIKNLKEDEMVTLIRSGMDVLEEYSADLIKDIAGIGKDSKFTKEDAHNKLLLTLTSGNKIAEKIANRSINQGGMF